MRSLISVAFASGIMAGVAAADPYADYRGTTLTVSWPTLSHFAAAESVIERFERETGITVDVQAVPYLDLRDIQLEEFAKPIGGFDLVSWVVTWKSEYVAMGALTPLEPFFENADLADPDYSFSDIIEPYVITGGMVGGRKGYLDGPGARLYGLPYGTETSIFAYRTDIFETHEIEVPRTYDQLRTAITKLHTRGIPAMTSRGRTGNDVVFAWLLHLGPHGGTIFDDDWIPVVNSPEALEATEFLRLVMQTGPEGIEDFTFGQSTFEFLSGGAAMYLDNFRVGAASRDPNFSVFADRIGFASHPEDVQCGAETGGFAIGIPDNSQNKEAAFLLLQYLTSREGDLLTTRGGGDPIRFSTLMEVQAERAESGAVLSSLLCANIDWRPLIPEWNAIQNDILGPALIEVTRTDRPIQEIMDEANAELRAFMDNAGYYR